MSSARVRTLIVDDEPLARAGLRRMLADISWITVVGESADGADAVRRTQTLVPELIFLDIQMPGLSGIEVLRHLPPGPRVVFTTAFAEHALAAFELGALDYLLKPFGSERFGRTLERVRASLGEPVAAGDRLAEALGKGPMSRLFARSGRSIVPIAVADIIRIESSGDYAAVFAGGEPHLLHVSLDRLAERLEPERFLRVHRSHLVNVLQVRRFARRLDGNYEAQLKDGSVVPVSRNRAATLRAWVASSG
ncbi:DNA-binding response regulator [Ahniella affigens]|uniref:DNA-binding response regulator n=1 Tax=Ahniella affigens TaxID=2021234 RepID=A0A2P1PNJ5_9GAMM|nr:LytTR family DNA-binding domain-containing protein [Ahniella affigens]AVP96406.1 DNA-binding response regulator [Ahniella affigens]